MILEDNSSDAELMKRHLRQAGLDFTAETAPDKNSFVSILKEFSPDIILADYAVPGFDGLAALNLARRRIADIPVIIVSGAIGEEFAVETLKAGATDYVLKDRLARLGPAVQRALQESEELAKRKDAQEKLRAAHRQEKERAAELNAVSQITDVALSTLKLDELLDSLLRRLVEVTAADTAVILLKEGDRLEARAGVGIREEVRAGFSVKMGEGFAGTIAASMQPLYVADAQKDPLVVNPLVKKHGIRSMLGLPMAAGDRLMGVLHIDWLSVHPRDEREVRLLELVADRASLAISNARLFEAEVEAQKVAKAELSVSNLLLETADALAGALEPQQVLELLADAVLQAVKTKRIFVALIDEKAGEATFKVSRGQPGLPVGTRTKLSEASPKAAQALRDKKPQLLDYETAAASKADKERAKKFNTRLALFVPLVEEDRVIGFINTDDPGERRGFSPREIDLVEAVASQAVIAIERARLYDLERESRRMGEALNEINSVVASVLRVEDIMRAVAQKATEAIGAERGVVYLREENHWVARYAQGFPPKLLGQRFDDAEAPFAVLAAREGGPIISKEPVYDERLSCRLMVDYDIKALLCTPLSLRGEIYGAILFTHQAPAEFTDSQADFARKLSSAISLALENARLFEAEHRVAGTLQESLLTVAEEIPGVDLGHIYRSATIEAAEVGGDFYDVFELEHGRIGIVIGDVAGKGIEAATLTALVKNTIRAYAYQKFVPSSVMAMTNKAVIKRTEAARTFVTVFFGILNTTSGVLRYCTAGHPPPVHKTAASALPLENHSPAIGVFPDHKFTEQGKVLYRGETLVLYTDGVTEARRRQREFFGEERLINLIAGLKPAGAKQITKAIFKEVMDFTGGNLADDTALLVVRLK